MLTSSPSPDVFVAATDKGFYVQLGARIAEARKAAGLTQVQLAEALGIAQQTMAHYEGGVSRIAVAMLPTVAKVLGVSIEDLVGEASRPGKRGPAPKIQQQLERVSQLPKPKQRMVLEVLEAVLAQQGR
jgi:transcriptional regulator with XRE-family HTH domain